MLFKNPRALLSEAAIDALETAPEAEEAIEKLEDVLTNNIEVVDDKGGIPVTTESCSILEASGRYRGRTRYLVTLETVMAIMETEGEAAAAEVADPGEAPTEEEIEANEPDPVNVVEKIAQDNGVDPEQVAVVISAENAKFLAEMSLLEAKCGKKGKAAKATKKLKKTADTVEALEGKVKLAKA